MNPETNRFEQLTENDQNEEKRATESLRRMVEHQSCLLRPNGEPVPSHWTKFSLNELVEIKGYTFMVKYIGETAILFEPAGLLVGEKKTDGAD